MAPTIATFSALSLVLCCLPDARADSPRIVARDDGDEIDGFPALSRDGSVIALVEPFEASSEADLVAVAFLRVRDGATIQRWVVHQRNDAGVLLPPPADGHGTTSWRRARNLTLELRSLGYRSMARIGEPPSDRDATLPLRGEGLRISQRRHQVTVRADRDGHARWTATLPEMAAFCGMSDERPQNLAPRVQDAWVDPTSSVGLLEFGHVYASCMCPADLSYLPMALGR